jgi:hypothetical protein
MPKNDYNHKRQARDQYYFEQGEAVGFQRCLDYMQNLLRNPKYVGRDIFGRKRWELLYEGLKDCDKQYGNAFTTEVDADVCQEKLDAGIREIFGDDTLPFCERYPMFKKTNYNKPMKGWVK